MTETESMVVRVAKAMATALKAQDGWTYVDSWDAETDSIVIDGAVELMPVVRAVIEAMFDPTPAMCRFAEDNFDRDADNIAVCWRAMIAKALEG